MKSPATPRRARTAFTLIECLVCFGVIGILAALLLPPIGRARERALATTCISNLRQLQLGWEAYLGDHGGAFPSNDAMSTGGVWRSTGDSWIGPGNATVEDSTESVLQGLLWRAGYQTSVAILHCPSDRNSLTGSRRMRIRSYSLNGNAGGRTNEVQRVLHFEFEIPSASQFMLFVDEHEDSIDDGHFLVWPNPDDRWVNLPADRHGQVGHWSCADGHIERHPWRARRTFQDRRTYWKRAIGHGDLADLRFLQSFTAPMPHFLAQP